MNSMTEQEQIRELETENARLREKLAAEKTVCRAKCLLVEHRGFSEPEAHRYIEKEAMDRQATRRSVAECIIEEYGGG